MIFGAPIINKQREDDTILPSKDQVQEVARWMPTGVKSLLRDLEPVEDLTGHSSTLVARMDKHGLLSRPKRGTHSGQIILSPLGKRVHKSLQRRLAGMEGT